MARFGYLVKSLGNLLGEYFAGDLLAAVDEVTLILAASDETADLTVADGKVIFRAPFAFTISSVSASVSAAPVGSAIVVDLAKNGTSVLSTLLTIDANEKTSLSASSPAVLSSAQASVAADDELSINVDQVGSSTAGSGLKITIRGYR